jgi:predicted  nucleic acid-binding Zn-ribbon protein
MPSNGNGKRLDRIDLRLTKAEEKIVAHDKSLAGIRTLLQQGARMIMALDRNFERLADAVADAEIRSLESREELRTEMKELAAAQKRTEEALRRFLEGSGNGHRRN